MKCLLCGLTGLGNAALDALIASEHIQEVRVITRSEKGEFPYYRCEHLEAYCTRHNVSCATDVDMKSEEVMLAIEEYAPDLLLTATFDQILPQSILSVPRKLAANIHPSLLPEYRGPTPTNWAIINGEVKSGLTIHELTPQIDAGDIFLQFDCPISGLTDGELRFNLAALAKEAIQHFISILANGKLRRIPQDFGQGAAFPKIGSPEGLALLANGNFQKDNIKRGVTPYPGVSALESIHGLHK